MKFTLRYGSDIIWRGDSLRDLLPQGLRFFSVCSGIEAASVAWSALGWQPVGFCEIEKFPSAVLAHHYPDVPNYGDFTKVDTRRLGRVDVLCGGTPCQAFSIAGARNSLDDARGNLTLAFVDLAHELVAGNGLRNVVWENVPGVLSTKDNAFGCFLAGLVGADDPFVPAVAAPLPGKSNRWYGWSAKERSHYIKWPRAGVVTGPKGRAAWIVKDAQYFGLAQRRERVIVIADFGNGADPATVLFEPEGVRRNSPPSREAGQGVTGTLSARSEGGGWLGTDFDLDGGLVPALARSLLGKPNDSCDHTLQTYVPQIARCVATREGSSQDFESTTMVAVSVTGPISHTLGTQNRGATEDGTGRGTPIICFSAKDYGADATIDLAPTLRAGGFTSSHANAGVMPAIAFVQNSRDEIRLMGGDGQIAAALSTEPGMHQQTFLAQTVALRGREDGGTAELGGDVAFALRASTGGGDKPHVLTHAIQAGALRENPNSGPDGVGVQADIAYTLEARSEVQAVQYTTAVRRLTPRECERLQGFQWLCSASFPRAWQDEAGRWWSPDYTAIPWRGKPASECPDGPRYKALGNSWAVPKFRWVGERIQRFMPLR